MHTFTFTLPRFVLAIFTPPRSHLHVRTSTFTPPRWHLPPRSHLHVGSSTFTPPRLSHAIFTPPRWHLHVHTSTFLSRYIHTSTFFLAKSTPPRSHLHVFPREIHTSTFAPPRFLTRLHLHVFPREIHTSTFAPPCFLTRSHLHVFSCYINTSTLHALRLPPPTPSNGDTSFVTPLFFTHYHTLSHIQPSQEITEKKTACSRFTFCFILTPNMCDHELEMCMIY